jgi:hypothetical protein
MCRSTGDAGIKSLSTPAEAHSSASAAAEATLLLAVLLSIFVFFSSFFVGTSPCLTDSMDWF